MKTLVLDAMGVIYSVGDDIGELLCPFIREHGGESDARRVETVYREASLGRLSSREFWERMRVDPALEGDYLARLQLSNGLRPFLESARSRFASVWCLSNDISEWSVKLRERWGLATLIDGFLISGDIGLRKPDPDIYVRLMREAKLESDEIVFVDDRVVNLDAAAKLGWETVLLGHSSVTSARHRTITSLPELLAG